jgi:hypothetical protein
MKGVSIIKDETKNKKYIQIDLDILKKRQDEIIDMLDAIIAESRKDEESVDFSILKKKLKKKSKL